MAATATKVAPKAAAIYCRISQDGEGSGLGVKRQEMDCRELAERRGWPIIETFIDNDVSAYSGKNRPQYRAMLEAIAHGELDAVVVWHLDRLTRRPIELERFFEVCDEAALKHMACVSGDIDLSTHDGQFHARILAAVARKESDDKSRRIKRKHRELAEAGTHPGSWSMMGYHYDKDAKALHVVPEEAEVVKEIFQLYADGRGLGEIGRRLEGRGQIGKRGRTRWKTTSAITRILDNETYAGLRLYDGNYYPLTNADAIIPMGLWKQVQQLRRAQAPPAKRREGKGSSLLTGLLFCPCGEPMWRDTYKSRDERSYYVCRRAARKRWGDCRLGGVSARRAERVITETFLARAATPYAERIATRSKRDLIGHLKSAPADDLEAKLARVEERMERLIELSLAQNGPLATKKFEQKATALEREREELTRQLGDDVASGVMQRRRTNDIEVLRTRLSDLPRIWDAATSAERNEMLRLAIDHVEVTGQGRFKNLDISWAGWLQ